MVLVYLLLVQHDSTSSIHCSCFGSSCHSLYELLCNKKTYISMAASHSKAVPLLLLLVKFLFFSVGEVFNFWSLLCAVAFYVFLSKNTAS